MKDPDFFKRLYRGFEAENLVAGKLFGAGLEAFKLPADFGFDLLVSNQMAKSIGPDPTVKRICEFPYVLQVKSRRVRADQFNNKNGRLEARVSFRITEDEYLLLSLEERSYLALVLFLPEDQCVLSEKHMIAWFKGSQLSSLKDATFLEPIVEDGRRFYELCVVVRLVRKARAEELLKGLLNDETISQKAFDVLQKHLPVEYVSDKSAEYVSLTRRSFSKHEAGKMDRSVVRKVSARQTDIVQIGSEVSDLGVEDNKSRPGFILLSEF